MVTDLPVGRELDAAIAEKVMGCRLIYSTDPDLRKKMDPACWCGDAPWGGIHGRGGIHSAAYIGRGLREIARYSTDIAAAWEVVEKVIYPHGWYLVPMPETDGKGWGVFRGDDWYEVAIGDSAPHAICLAALKAVGA